MILSDRTYRYIHKDVIVFNPSSSVADAPEHPASIVSPGVASERDRCIGNLSGVKVTPVSSRHFLPDSSDLTAGENVCTASIADRHAALQDKRVVIETVSLVAIEADAVNLRVSFHDQGISPRYNTSNHWMYEARDRPADYQAVEHAALARNWMGKLKNDVRSFTIHPQDVITLTEARNAYHLLGRLSGGCREDLDDLAWSRRYQELSDALDTHSFFVRTDHTSLKYGLHGNKIYHRLSDVLESIVSSRISHSPLGRVDNGESLTLYLIPWQALDPDFEFRVFVHQNRVTAISQQDIYRKNEALCKLSDGERTTTISHLVHLILDTYDSKIRNAVDNMDSYVMDLAVQDNDGEMSVYFIELNPFGKDYSSGAAAYSWVEDGDIVYGEEKNVVHFRYVV